MINSHLLRRVLQPSSSTVAYACGGTWLIATRLVVGNVGTHYQQHPTTTTIHHISGSGIILDNISSYHWSNRPYLFHRIAFHRLSASSEAVLFLPSSS